MLQREGALSPEGVSALPRRCRGARGSRRANESKTRCSTPRGDVGTGTAPPPVTGREEPQGPGAFWSALGKSQSGEKRSANPPRQTKTRTPQEKVLPQNRGGNKGSDGGTGMPEQEAELTSPPSRAAPCPAHRPTVPPGWLLSQEKGSMRSRARRGRTAAPAPHTGRGPSRTDRARSRPHGHALSGSDTRRRAAHFRLTTSFLWGSV